MLVVVGINIEKLLGAMFGVIDSAISVNFIPSGMNLTGELDLSKVVHYPLHEDQYFKQEFKKTQLVLHFSAGWDNSRGMIDGWKADKYRVATAFGLTDDGSLIQAFDPKHWASHVGYFIQGVGGNDKAYKLVPGTNNRETNLAIEVRTIGIEICNWGALRLMDGKYHTWASTVTRPITLPESKVCTYEKPFRGSNYYERYTDQEIETLWKWIRHYCKAFNIPATFDVSNFDLNVNAIKGVPGVYTHCNFRADKGDLAPQKELVEMLKQL